MRTFFISHRVWNGWWTQSRVPGSKKAWPKTWIIPLRQNVPFYSAACLSCRMSCLDFLWSVPHHLPTHPSCWTYLKEARPSVANSLIIVGHDQRYEQEIDRSTIVVVCQPTPLPKLGQSCVRLWGYFLIIPHGQPKLGISWRVVGWIFLILPQIDSQSSNWVYWIKEGSQQPTSAI